jgi:hypothetical protein
MLDPGTVPILMRLYRGPSPGRRTRSQAERERAGRCVRQARIVGSAMPQPLAQQLGLTGAAAGHHPIDLGRRTGANMPMQTVKGGEKCQMASGRSPQPRRQTAADMKATQSLAGEHRGRPVMDYDGPGTAGHQAGEGLTASGRQLVVEGSRQDPDGERDPGWREDGRSPVALPSGDAPEPGNHDIGRAPPRRRASYQVTSGTARAGPGCAAWRVRRAGTLPNYNILC